MDYTIQHGTVIDGTGTARCAADVLLRNGKIAEVAPHLPPVGEVIEARGMIVCPGFIDMHSQLVVFTPSVRKAPACRSEMDSTDV
jgi:N-acyl-D-amino-acid deacylase